MFSLVMNLILFRNTSVRNFNPSPLEFYDVRESIVIIPYTRKDTFFIF